MSPELRLIARAQAFSELSSTIHPIYGNLAAGKGRFHNHFCRDSALAMAQSLSVSANLDLDPSLLIFPGIKTINTIRKNQSKLNIQTGQMPGENAHEAHDKTSPQGRLQELKESEWPVKTDEDGSMSMVVYYAKDANALTVIAAERLLGAIGQKFSKDVSQKVLQKWWPFLERTILYDIFENDINGDGLIETNPKKGDKLVNQTWRDSRDAFIYGKGAGIIPEAPLTHFSNNCFAIGALESGANLAEQIGLDGFSRSLKRRRERAMDVLQDKFWLKDEQCYAAALDNKGRALPTVTNESAIGLFTGALYPESARIAAETITRASNGLVTDYGTRTRSIYDRHFKENGNDSYHRGTIWPQVDTQFALGCDRYGFNDISQQIKMRTARLVSQPEYGCIELVAVTKDGQIDYYREDGKRVACFSQAWVIHGVLGITAPESHRELQQAA